MSRPIDTIMKSQFTLDTANVQQPPQKLALFYPEMRARVNRDFSKTQSARPFSGAASTSFWQRFRKVSENSTTYTSGTTMEVSMT